MNRVIKVPVRDLVALHSPIVVGGAVKLALSGFTESQPFVQRQAAGLSRHLWEQHAGDVVRLARGMRSEFRP